MYWMSDAHTQEVLHGYACSCKCASTLRMCRRWTMLQRRQQCRVPEETLPLLHAKHLRSTMPFSL